MLYFYKLVVISRRFGCSLALEFLNNELEKEMYHFGLAKRKLIYHHDLAAVRQKK